MLKLLQAAYNQLRRHAEEAYPEESCGILLGIASGDTREVHEAVRCRNLHPAPEKNYEIDLREVIRLQRESRQRGLEVVGFYHSHPDHPASPSPTDLEQAHWIGHSYVITSVQQGRALQTRSWLLTGTWESKSFQVEDLALN
jgi:proteasome lid subunit RPN8/RPN11